jgi:hypothetical protein
MVRARQSRARSIHFSSKHRLAEAAPTAPPICGRRSVQSTQGRQKTRRFARAPQILVQLRLWLKTRRPGQGDVHDALKHLRDLWSGESVVAMTTLLYEHEQPRSKQFAEMPARRLRRYAGGEC